MKEKTFNFILSLLIPFLFISINNTRMLFFDNFVLNPGKSYNYDLNEDPTSSYKISPVEDNQIIYSSSSIIKFSSSISIDTISVEGEVNFLNFSYKNGILECLFSDFKDSSEILVNFYHENNLIDKCALYFAESTNGTFYCSAISLDIAKRMAGHQLSYNLVLDNREENNTKIRTVYSENRIGSTGSVYGWLKWTDWQGNTHPLIGAKIRATMSNSWRSVETYSNEQGYYMVNYADIWHFFGGLPAVHILTENNNIKVHNGGTYEKIYEFNSSNGGEFSYTFSPELDGDMVKAMMVFQGAKNFSDYAVELNGGNQIDFCNIQYPYGTDSSSYSNGTIRLSGKTPPDSSSPESYACRDALGHEYAHHLQKIFGISDNPGGAHFIPSNNIDEQIKNNFELGEAKERGHKLSWAEGWASYWSIVAQLNFSEEFKNIYTVADYEYTSYNGLRYSLDSYDKGYGDADEQVVQRVMFRLYDSTINEIDKFNLGDSFLWNIVKNNKPLTFYEFIEDLYNFGLDRNDLGIILDNFGVFSPGLVHSNMRYINRSPDFYWSTDMGSTNFKFDEFDFHIKCGIQSYQHLNIKCDGEDFISYRLSSIRTRKMILSGKSLIEVYIVARQTYSYISGNYYSKIFTFEKPTENFSIR